jgi:hypothetical protein
MNQIPKKSRSRFDFVRVSYHREVGHPHALYDIVEYIDGSSEVILARSVTYEPARRIAEALNAREANMRLVVEWSQPVPSLP